jgi:ABC-type molybdate transport system permease subunit
MPLSRRVANTATLRSFLWLAVMALAWRLSTWSEHVASHTNLAAVVVSPVLIASVVYGLLAIRSLGRAPQWQHLPRHARGRVVWTFVGAVVLGGLGTCVALTLEAPEVVGAMAGMAALFNAAGEAMLALRFKRCVARAATTT